MPQLGKLVVHIGYIFCVPIRVAHRGGPPPPYERQHPARIASLIGGAPLPLGVTAAGQDCVAKKKGIGLGFAVVESTQKIFLLCTQLLCTQMIYLLRTKKIYLLCTQKIYLLWTQVLQVCCIQVSTASNPLCCLLLYPPPPAAIRLPWLHQAHYALAEIHEASI